MTRRLIRALTPLGIILATLWGLAWISMLDGNSTAGAAVIGIPAGVALFAAGAYAVAKLPDRRRGRMRAPDDPPRSRRTHLKGTP